MTWADMPAYIDLQMDFHRISFLITLFWIARCGLKYPKHLERYIWEDNITITDKHMNHMFIVVVIIRVLSLE